MQYAVTDNEVEGLRLEHRAEQIHLKKRNAFDLVRLAERLPQLERVQTAVCCEDGPAPGHAQKIAQLACAAANFKGPGAEGNLFVRQAGKYAAGRFFPQAQTGIQLIIVGKRSFLVERLHDLRHVRLIGRPIVQPEQLRNSTFAGKRPPAGRTTDWIAGGVEAAATDRTDQALGVPGEQFGDRDFLAGDWGVHGDFLIVAIYYWFVQDESCGANSGTWTFSSLETTITTLAATLWSPMR